MVWFLGPSGGLRSSYIWMYKLSTVEVIDLHLDSMSQFRLRLSFWHLGTPPFKWEAVTCLSHPYSFS